jgi:hypothetical protein
MMTAKASHANILIVGVTPQRLNDWLAGLKHPSLEQGLKLQEYLRRQRG